MAYNPRFYRGNPHLKSAWTTNEYTLDQIMELKKCSEDIFYFVKNYVKITTPDADVVPFDPYPFQHEFIENMESNRLVVLLSSRQSGKTTTVAVYALWKILFNESFKILILAHKQAMAKEILDRIKNCYEHIPFWMQHGIVECNKTQIELVNKSRITCSATTSDAGRGSSNSLVISDEFSAVKKSVADDFMGSVFPSISAGKKTQLVILSTPKGMNHFYHIYDGAVKGKNEFKPMKVNWRDIPGRDEKWEKTQRELLGSKFEEEHECSFIGSSNTLLDTDTMKNIEPILPVSFQGDLQIFELPIQDQDREVGYVMVADVAEGVGGDYSVISVIKIEDQQYTQVAVFRNNVITPLEYAHKIVEVSTMYNEAFCLVESNSIGNQVLYILESELEFERLFYTKRENNKIVLELCKSPKNRFGVRTTSSTKNLGCNRLKELVKQNILKITSSETFEELTNFGSNGKTFQASSGCTDDIVMTLVLFSWLTIQPAFKEYEVEIVKDSRNLTFSQNIPPTLHIPYIQSELGEEGFVDEDNNVWIEVGKNSFR